mmetsp:Transcript_7362/g.14025  ORF Transcript_7362/g.14025 Transcript_7362/m.14025 type:complete len:202 (+) Transcript_7362:2-607(+)
MPAPASTPSQSFTVSGRNGGSEPVRSFQSSPPIANSISNVQNFHPGQTSSLMQQSFQPSKTGGHDVASPHHGSPSDMFRGSQHAGNYGNQQQQFIQQFLRGRSLGAQGQQFSPYITRPATPPAPTGNDLDLLAALALGGASNSHGQPPPDLQSLIRNAVEMPNSHVQSSPDLQSLIRNIGSNPALLLQLQQLLQNQQFHRS